MADVEPTSTPPSVPLFLTATNQYGEYWKSSALSFNILYFLALIPITGFLGLDHLYARSPKTAALKAITNMFSFGWWYIYDAMNIMFRSDQVKIFGLSAPLVGPLGIGAGQFSGDKKDEDKSSRFFIYALLVCMAPFGLDYFYVGNNWMGFIKLFFTFIFLPIALLIGLWNIVKVFFMTGQVLDENHEFFGSIPSLKYQQMMAQQGVGAAKGGIFGWFYGWLLSILQSDLLLAIPVVGPAIQLATASLNTATIAVDAAGETISVAKDTAVEVIQATGETAKSVAAVATKAQAIQDAFTPQGATQAIAEAALASSTSTIQKGGGDGGDGGGAGGLPATLTSDFSSTLLLSVLALVVVSGGLATFWRVIQNFRRKPKNVSGDGSTESGSKKSYDRPPDARSA